MQEIAGFTDDLVARAERYAIGAHGRIDQRRKYTNQAYDTHLKAVVDIVSSVTDHGEVLAAAWLHDTLEDTPATYDDLEHEFGTEVARRQLANADDGVQAAESHQSL